MKLHATSFGMPSPAHPISEDAFAISKCDDGGLLCVLSDGVGSSRDPRRSAQRVVRWLSDNFNARPRHWAPRKAFERLIDEANSSLYREGAYLDGVPSMQATLAAVSFRGNVLSGINIGDSPVLLTRDGTTRRLSENHVSTNRDGMEMLTNAVGAGNSISYHYFETEVREGDTVVITSDGLTRLMDDQKIGQLATRYGSARTLIQEAFQSSESKEIDDLSAIVVDVKEISPSRAEVPDNMPALPLLTRGGKIDDYTLLRPIMGNERVWLASEGEQKFVLKFIPAESANDEDGIVRMRFEREAWNACRLQGPFFVKASLPASGSRHYYVMDYVDAPSLGFLLKTKRLAIDQAVELAKFLVNACQWLLRSELIHGDIKSDNILIYRTGEGLGYKLLDLGLASAVFTDSGVAGTPTYLAPERFTGAVVTERTEIFSIGVTLYEALTGKLPYGAIERFQRPRFAAAQRLSHWNPNVPPWLDAVVMKCLALDANRRFQHFSELSFALDHPDRVTADSFTSEPLLERNPLLVYKTGFWILAVTTIYLIIRLLSKS